MSFWKGPAKRRDANEKAIRTALACAGAVSWQISGRGLPDLLVRYKGCYYVGEVKTEKGTLKPTQGEFPIWRSAEDALKAIGAMPC